jgi:hypothetical protein
MQCVHVIIILIDLQHFIYILTCKNVLGEMILKMFCVGIIMEILFPFLVLFSRFSSFLICVCCNIPVCAILFY